jgi:hypothetical protein
MKNLLCVLRVSSAAGGDTIQLTSSLHQERICIYANYAHLTMDRFEQAIQNDRTFAIEPMNVKKGDRT